MFGPPLPSHEEMARAGFLPDDFEDDDEPGSTFWPENAEAVALFNLVQTQWRIGFSGPTSLDYGTVYPLLDRMDLKHAEWDQLLDDIRVMEAAALAEMHKK